MRLRPPLRMSVTRRGEKEQRLGEFVGDYLAEVQQARSQPGAEILLVASSGVADGTEAVRTLLAGSMEKVKGTPIDLSRTCTDEFVTPR